ncbi:hypothetical protein SAMN05660479_01031 [Microbulbifer thermotolerans]|uniref:hypothetical protein n=1 Tax=Microbulbifer thermotolerans TaxID=252514 RepID=UPI0008DEADF0|nr:hypothetical protein [Microbulbifer thermotolerans]SFC06612.1 hypothetical protein SAMN05660479_01031 [Microbulbifer thermotolerans]
MVNRSPNNSRFWACLLLLLALLAAQPLWAEHIHLKNGQVELCDLCFNHMPAAFGSDFKLDQPAPAVLYNIQSAPVPRDCQPERQRARAPPAHLSLR